MEPVEVLWDGDEVPLSVDRHTPVKTVPSRRTTYVGGKNLFSVPYYSKNTVKMVALFVQLGSQMLTNQCALLSV